MIEINLLKYFDKSFSEIYRIENEPEVSDKKALIKKFFIILSTSKKVYLPVLLFLMILFAFSLYNLGTTMSGMDSNIQTKNKTKIDRKSPPVKKNTEKKGVIPVTIDNDSGEINGKDQKPVKAETAKTVKQQSLEKESNKNLQSSTIKPIKNKKEQQNTKSYVIIIKGLDKSKIDKLQKLSDTYGVKISKTLHSQTEMELWHVYVPDVHSDIQIGDIRVKTVATFSDKNKAVNFAKKRKGKFFIKKENVMYEEYTIKIEGFNSIKEAKLFAEEIK
ncbi:MAG: hypothetical protein FXF49_10215 [Flexistipes sinusarabici]|uniref:SPOR domain-containing protein n=1 Tax=Flexistipes sinusarabici TaxID=2352 RepID=A0A5D0MMJ4_FLESI|nr:hypothetical protein [Flexistipes sinusarabici]TYB32691.1 MAG: hypothetical protein FXF49_10215 [Flexistipes sinusarabici]